jgi:hypothetical protein
VTVNENFNANYTSAVLWNNSDPSSHPSDFNNLYGLSIANAAKGLIYGVDIGGTPDGLAQSENVVYGFYTHSVQVPFIENETYGGVTFVGGLMDCDAYDWASQPGYNATTYYTNAYAFRVQAGMMKGVGLEVLKAGSQVGYGMWGQGFSLSGSTIEIASTQAYLTGSAAIAHNLDGYMSSTTAPAFVVDSAATGTLSLNDYRLERASAPSSTALFVQASSGDPLYTVSVANSDLDWRYTPGGSPNYLADPTKQLGTHLVVANTYIHDTGGASPNTQVNLNLDAQASGVDTTIINTTPTTAGTENRSLVFLGSDNSGSHVGNLELLRIKVTSANGSVAQGKVEFLQNGGATPTLTLPADASGVDIANGTNIVYRCLTSGAVLPAGSLTITAAACGTSTDTGLRVK